MPRQLLRQVTIKPKKQHSEHRQRLLQEPQVMEEVRVIMRESQGGSTLLAGGAQCHFFNCQQTCQHIATAPCSDKRPLGENTAHTGLETFAESSRFPRCKTMQDPTCPPHSTTDKLHTPS